MAAPLAGVRVVDLSEGLAGPFCSLMLADVGAAVTKVEPPAGDVARGWGPPFQGDASVFFHCLNRGKRCLRIDLGSAAGRTSVRDLVADADVLLIHRPPGEPDRLGLGYEELRALNRGLIYCHITDLGSAGPWARLPASELTVQALSGYHRYIGQMGREPIRIGVDIIGTSTGLFAFQAIVAALLGRGRTGGEGQRVDLSMLGAALDIKSVAITAQSCTDEWSGFHLLAPQKHPERGWQCKDGRVTLDFREKAPWETFMRRIGLARLVDDPRFENWVETLMIGDDTQSLRPLYEEATKRFTVDEILAISREVDCFNMPVNDYRRLDSDAQARAMDVFVETAGSGGATERRVNSPWEFLEVADDSATPPAAPSDPGGALRAANGRAGHGPLNGVLIADFTVAGVGPATTRYLGLLGATIVHVEPPWGDYIHRVRPKVRGVSTVYMVNNINKRSLALDLRDAADKEIAYDLIRRADVFVQNYRAGSLERMGLGYTDVQRINPRIVYLNSMSFGDRGPLAPVPAIDPHIQAVTGFADQSGFEGEPGEFLRYFALMDLTSAMTNACGVLLGLYARERTGRGRLVNTAMLRSCVAIQVTRLSDYLATGTPPPVLGSGNPYVVPDQAFKALDRYIAVSALTEPQWQAVCRVLGLTELADDRRFASNADRVRHRRELIPLLSDAIAGKPAQWWLQGLHAEGVPASTFMSFPEYRHHRHMHENQFLKTVEKPGWPDIVMGDAPWRFSATPVGITTWPEPGEDKAAVLDALGIAAPATAG